MKDARAIREFSRACVHSTCGSIDLCRDASRFVFVGHERTENDKETVEKRKATWVVQNNTRERIDFDIVALKPRKGVMVQKH